MRGPAALGVHGTPYANHIKQGRPVAAAQGSFSDRTFRSGSRGRSVHSILLQLGIVQGEAQPGSAG
jgi:hypothetical protein